MMFIPKNQARLIELIDLACKSQAIIGIKAERGFGVNYTVEKYVKAFPHNKVVLADIEYAPGLKGVVVGLYKPSINVRFSNLQHQHASLHELTRILSNRMTRDLKDKNVVIFLDSIHQLGPAQHKYLLHFLKRFSMTRPCGIIIRGNEAMFKKLADKHPELNDRYFTTVDEWKTFKAYQPEEIEMFVKSYGITDQEIIQNISVKTTSFTVARKLVDNYFKKVSK